MRARLAVEELGRLPFEQPLQVVHRQATARHGHRQELGAEGAEDLHCARVRRLLDRDEVARVEQRARDQIEALLRAVDDQDVLGARLEAEAQQVAREVLAQRRVAGRRIVLQELAPLLANDAVEHAAERVGREERAVRHAAGEGDHARGRPGHLAEGPAAARIRRDDLGGLGKMARPLEARRVGRGLDRSRRLLGDEGALPHVGACPAAGDQVLVGLRHRGAIDAEVPSEVARRGQLHAGRQQPLGDQPLQVQLDLSRQRQPSLAVLCSVERYSHGPLVPAIIQTFIRCKAPIGWVWNHPIPSLISTWYHSQA